MRDLYGALTLENVTTCNISQGDARPWEMAAPGHKHVSM